MTLSLRADVSVAETDAGLVILDEVTGKYWQTNSAGALVLQDLLAGAGELDAASRLEQGYTVSRDRAIADVRALVARLKSAGLICEAGRLMQNSGP